jgi:hypothetical protein
MSIQLSIALPFSVLCTVTVATPLRADPVELARLVPGIIAAAAGAPAATGMSWAAYDGATHTPLVGAAADVRLGTRVVIGTAATYASRTSEEPAELRPSVFARVQILDQAKHGIDLGTGFAYRQDRFVSEEGLLQATLSLGVHGEIGAVLVNLGYGQDGEGDDHLGDARLVAFRTVAGTLHVGFDGHVQWLFDSSDPNRAQHATPSLELTVAPAITYGVGPALVMLEVGWSGVDFAQFRSGVLALGGVGASF